MLTCFILSHSEDLNFSDQLSVASNFKNTTFRYQHRFRLNVCLLFKLLFLENCCRHGPDLSLGTLSQIPAPEPHGRSRLRFFGKLEFQLRKVFFKIIIKK